MAHTIASINPLSTAPAYAPDFRGETANAYTISLPTTAGAGASLPKIETFPATFMAAPDGARTTDVCGFFTAVNASTVVVHGATTGFSTSATTTADYVVISISNGVVSITNAGTNASSAATVYTVNRVG